MASTIYFGSFVVNKQVFYKSTHSYALVNLKPLLPGHVLVCPYRVVSRIKELTAEEASDFFLTVQKVSNVIERTYDGHSMNIAIQDGPLAGQSVPHVHCHIIPRRLNDLPNVDDIYRMLNSSNADIELSFSQLKGLNSGLLSPEIPDSLRMPRTEQEMAREAQMLQSKFSTEKL
ncbi:HIT-like domain-containing protein [Dipodascopsis tothii]|uniref:HIT-like domain-containing protein n=1 Tax=Dipodascopsis tothii TaxID=44089 RepID=UPI0034D01ECC